MRTAWVTWMLSLGIATSAAAQGPTVTSGTKTLNKGTKIVATIKEPISSSKNKIGDEVSATIDNEVKDATGTVLFPAGASAKVKIIDIKSGDDSNKNGVLALQVTSVHANNQDLVVEATTGSVGSESRKPGWTSDTKNIGIGAAAGAVVGGVAGGSLKGAVIGGILGAAGGAVVTHEMKGREVVVKPGAKIDFTLAEPVRVMVS